VTTLGLTDNKLCHISNIKTRRDNSFLNLYKNKTLGLDFSAQYYWEVHQVRRQLPFPDPVCTREPLFSFKKMTAGRHFCHPLKVPKDENIGLVFSPYKLFLVKDVKKKN